MFWHCREWALISRVMSWKFSAVIWGNVQNSFLCRIFAVMGLFLLV